MTTHEDKVEALARKMAEALFRADVALQAYSVSVNDIARTRIAGDLALRDVRAAIAAIRSLENKA